MAILASARSKLISRPASVMPVKDHRYSVEPSACGAVLVGAGWKFAGFVLAANFTTRSASSAPSRSSMVGSQISIQVEDSNDPPRPLVLSQLPSAFCWFRTYWIARRSLGSLRDGLVKSRATPTMAVATGSLLLYQPFCTSHPPSARWRDHKVCDKS
ncbi:hypothetical protein SDC9_80937 [bioreactor metagenome]|uniref:Uncharacterized protein n=1 Tax=bioreactor metagenome TaxID=1076179 RepID=A0A644Z0E4_9ZZZZ